MGNEWGEFYRLLNEQKNAGKAPAEIWEEKRIAHTRLIRQAWDRYNALVASYEAQGFNGHNPFKLTQK